MAAGAASSPAHAQPWRCVPHHADVHTVPQFPGEPQHSLFGATCWCRPVATLVTGAFGARTIVHRSFASPAENGVTGAIPVC